VKDGTAMVQANRIRDVPCAGTSFLLAGVKGQRIMVHDFAGIVPSRDLFV
jgi:hypothetical protein